MVRLQGRMRRVHNAPPVAAEPTPQLVRWRVIQVRGNQDLMGWCLRHREGRLSAPLISCAIDARHALTLSSRAYAPIGAPGRDAEIVYVVDSPPRAKGWSMDGVEDVTGAWEFADRRCTG